MYTNTSKGVVAFTYLLEMRESSPNPTVKLTDIFMMLDG